MSKIMNVDEAVSLIKPGMTVGISGFVGSGHPEEISRAVEKSFLERGVPNNLTMFWGASGSNNKDNFGLNRWCKQGLIKRIIAGHYNLQIDLPPLVNSNKVSAYNIPQGVFVNLCEAIASHKPGVITRVGLNTFADPRIDGCKINEAAKQDEDIVRLMEIDGEEFLFYKAFPVDVAVIRGTTADERGNISIEKEAINLEFFALASAAKGSCGKVIVEVERVTEYGTMDPRMVEIPGILVDAVVVARPENHWQTCASPYEPFLCGDTRLPLKDVAPLHLDERKVIARRCAMELISDAVVNLGIGMPEGIGAVAAEEGLSDMMTMIVEPGVIGGIPQSGLRFGTAINPDAIIPHARQFDLIDGGILDKCFLGLAEVNPNGDVNVSKFGPRVAGCGGFVNISQNTRDVIFCGTLTSGGLKEEVRDGKLVILQEGRNKKFIKSIAQTTFSGEYAQKYGQNILYVTERAVFKLTEDGLMLTEIAPGVDLKKDILDQMEFTPIIPDTINTMDSRIFQEGPMGIKEEILRKER